jgi:hypothetical protein
MDVAEGRLPCPVRAPFGREASPRAALLKSDAFAAVLATAALQFWLARPRQRWKNLVIPACAARAIKI